jgi:hypothetical protein
VLPIYKLVHLETAFHIQGPLYVFDKNCERYGQNRQHNILGVEKSPLVGNLTHSTNSNVSMHINTSAHVPVPVQVESFIVSSNYSYFQPSLIIL